MQGETADSMDLFGLSVSAFGDCCVIGSPTARNVGAIFVFPSNDLDNYTAIYAPAPASNQEPLEDSFFGYSVATCGDSVFVGAPGSEDNAGAVFAFALDVESQMFHLRATLTPSDGHPNDLFGEWC